MYLTARFANKSAPLGRSMADTTSFGEEEASLLFEGNDVRCMDLRFGIVSLSVDFGKAYYVSLSLVVAF